MDYQKFRTWTQPSQTQAADTAIAVPIDPYRDGANDPFVYAYGQGTRYVPNWFRRPCTRINQFVATSDTTAHTWYVLRPKNWTYIAEAVTKNDTTVVMYDNPGTYSTNYKYPIIPGGASACLAADNTPAGGDYVAFQLDNGAWHFSTVASLSTLTLTIDTATPNVDGATAAVGRILFFFGVGGDKDPATGRADPSFQPPVSATTRLYDRDGLAAGRPGDPMILVNANATAASTLVALSGSYTRF